MSPQRVRPWCSLRLSGINPIAAAATIAVLLATLAGCEQKELPEQINLGDHFDIGNPEPVARDFKRINAQHKILMAVMDSGIDYNHPELRENIHFDLDENGQPTRDAQGHLNGLGKDYIGQDGCASWRLVDTDAFPFDRRVPDTQEDILKSQTAADYDRDAVTVVSHRQCLLDAMTSVSPDAKSIAKYIGPYRYKDYDEDGSNIHGTHVAGLMTYDRPDFGVIPYRMLRYYRTKAEIKAENHYEVDLFIKNFAEAVDHAHTRGVKIVNLSLGGSFQAPDDTSTPDARREFDKFQKQKTVTSEKMTEIIRNHPDMLFVAAAGNDSGRSDNRTRIQFPCGLDAENLLCVGALNPDGRRASFTNLPFSKGLSMVYAPGYEITSLKVSDTCPSLTSAIHNLFDATGSDSAICKLNAATGLYDRDKDALALYSGLIADYAKLCETPVNRYMRMSGTSMATPLVSHMVAEIWVNHSEITAAKDIIPLLSKTFPLTAASGTDAVPPDSLSPTIPRWNHGEGFFNASWDPSRVLRAGISPASPKNDDGSGFHWDLGTPGSLPLPAGLVSAANNSSKGSNPR